MSYWTGSGVDSYEEERNIYCGDCEKDFDDVECKIDGSYGCGVCPECGNEIEFEI